MNQQPKPSILTELSAKEIKQLSKPELESKLNEAIRHLIEMDADIARIHDNVRFRASNIATSFFLSETSSLESAKMYRKAAADNLDFLISSAKTKTLDLPF